MQITVLKILILHIIMIQKKNKTNIKLIKITGISKDGNITLYYPTCNIGASKFLSFEELSR
jgi:hypothetical protein